MIEKFVLRVNLWTINRRFQ